MKLSDFKGLFHRSALTVLTIDNPYGDYHRSTLKPDKNTIWISGDHGIFTLPLRKVSGKPWRAFSIASTPQEEMLIIGTRAGEETSSFKKELLCMKEGERVNVIGPFGWFKVREQTSPIVLIAGGVGITPVRALLKELENDTDRNIHLIYQSSDYYLFGDELIEIAAANPKISLLMTRAKKETEEAILSLIRPYNTKAYYYVSGPIPFIKSIKKYIKLKGVGGQRIISDPFYGY
ncbi:MAG: FAD-dependent oxidoreductase [Clostridiales bacterium]|nr:FAD-dependent oxidoreductase [Clostridiales bacterium]